MQLYMRNEARKRLLPKILSATKVGEILISLLRQAALIRKLHALVSDSWQSNKHLCTADELVSRADPIRSRSISRN